jgi:flavorubredoxin
MAEIIARGVREAGRIDVELLDIEHLSSGEIEENIVRSGGILIGSPTINRNTLLPVYRLFSVINPIRDKGKPASAFGSYGWSGEAVPMISDHLKNLKLEIVQEGLTTKFLPGKDQTPELLEFGRNYGRKFLEHRSTE